jgi:hypothetical protein
MSSLDIYRSKCDIVQFQSEVVFRGGSWRLAQWV